MVRNEECREADFELKDNTAYHTVVCFIYGIRRFITVFTKARKRILSWASLCLGRPRGLFRSGLL